MKKSHKIVTGIIAAGLFSFGFTVLLKWWQNAELFNLSTLVFSITNWIIILLVAFTFIKILALNSCKTTVQLKKTIVPSFVFFVIVTIVASLTIFSIGVWLLYLLEDLDTANIWEHLWRREFPGAIKSISGGILVAYAVFFYKVWRQSVDREQRLREENLSYKYRNLKTQVNPHFLFNSLNTLSELINTDAGKADLYVQKLSSIYRYILDHEETDQVPLEDELTFVKQYFDLQKERDGKKIHMDIRIENTGKISIIPVSLQILVENALKHNARSAEKPLQIRIEQVGERIIVSNPIQRKNTLQNSSGTGLSNLKERVKLITGKEMKIYQSDNCFIVELPVNNS